MLEPYHDLEIWQRANSLCLKLHRLTTELPLRERGGLISAIRTSSRAIPLAIADGAMSDFIKDYIANLKTSHRHLIALKTDLLIARYLKYIDKTTLRSFDDDVNGLIHALLVMIQQLSQSSSALNATFAYAMTPFLN